MKEKSMNAINKNEIGLLSDYLRPTSFDELTLSTKIINHFKSMHESKNIMNMLFYGKPGAGKSTATKIFSQNISTLTLNGAHFAKVENVRGKIFDYASSGSLFDNQKLIVIDDAEFLSSKSQGALRGVIEEHSDTCRFIFTVNKLTSIDAAIKSRLHVINFDIMPTERNEMINRYSTNVLQKLLAVNPELDERQFRAIIVKYFPDFRTIANQLQSEMTY